VFFLSAPLCFSLLCRLLQFCSLPAVIKSSPGGEHVCLQLLRAGKGSAERPQTTVPRCFSLGTAAISSPVSCSLLASPIRCTAKAKRPPTPPQSDGSTLPCKLSRAGPSPSPEPLHALQTPLSQLLLGHRFTRYRRDQRLHQTGTNQRRRGKRTQQFGAGCALKLGCCPRRAAVSLARGAWFSRGIQAGTTSRLGPCLPWSGGWKGSCTGP